MEKGAVLQGSAHVLVAQQFVREDLEALGELATVIRRMSKSREGAVFLKGLLCDKRAMLYFAQPSSRTYLSFLAACQILGLDTMDVRDSKTSSEVKG
jgi:aspartate carbamoyltransferase catalytic subunit